jgi:class 3 adenylate cyclase
VLYGERRGDAPSPSHHPQTITKLEAMLVELLASGVAAGLARLDQEWAALAAKSRFEQFFTPELAQLVEAQPELLRGQDREVTVLFCDIRGFSQISERLGPARTVEWVSDVIEALSQCVVDQGGIVIDYIGDELLAMWGAPTPHPDHPQRACRAALAMRAALPRLNQRWQARIGSPIALGIGINTGIAHVGNTGNRLKLKYGPLGNTVNLASRVQGATKYLGADFLVTGPTRARLGAEFAARRLGTVRVVHIAEPVELHQLADAPTPAWQELARQYEAALAAFERNEPCETARLLGSLLVLHPDDRPSLILIERAVERIVGKAPDNDPVWILPNK